MHHHTKTWLTGLLAVFAATVPLSAAPLFYEAPWLGDANTSVAEWDVFTTANGLPGNTPDIVSDADALIVNDNSQAMLTGGNIYGFFGINDFTLTDSSPFETQTVLLQLNVLGEGIDTGSVLLNGLAPTLQGLTQVAGSGMSVEYGYYFQWDLSSSPIASDTTYSIEFAASGQHSSLDAVRLDTADSFQAIPEPTSAMLLGLAGLAYGLSRRRNARA